MSLRFDAASLSLGGSRILQPLSLQLAQGEQVALIGPSGAGKSSLLLLANSCHRPDGGSVQLLGQDPWQLGAPALRRLRSRIGSVYQHPPLPALQRVVTAIGAGQLGQLSTLAALRRLLWPQDVAAIRDALQRVQLGDKLWQRCDRLSGGQRQRVGIARVLYQQPELLLADEPVSALDPRLADDTVALLCADARARGATLLVSLHSVELALAHFPRLIGLRDGRIAFDLPRAEVTPSLLAALYAGEQPATADEPALGSGIRIAPC
ncbi:phosphonate ABC transporter [Vogesella sp. EB]|uniref:phosphonate ABC transporter ATP-binding protein n=1 Tax=Vogesella sp. EB TaxID=1526735 RepID=UPI00064CF704|nr:ATP-binding cassette domain-containing protein [Vogesella sp. EB]KMJ54471.1 phosphonate ABC transporter [Vogesella sp. EB]